MRAALTAQRALPWCIVETDISGKRAVGSEIGHVEHLRVPVRVAGRGGNRSMKTLPLLVVIRC